MISDYITRQKVLTVQRRRAELVAKKNDIVLELKKFQLSENQKLQLNKGHSLLIDEDVQHKRRFLTKELVEIERQLGGVNLERRELARQEDASKNEKLREIFLETFTLQQFEEMDKEATRRVNGEHPSKLSFNIKDGVEIKAKHDIYKKLAKEQLEKMIEFRLLLTSVIEKGCKEFGDSEFLKIISPLNRLIIPIQELEKIKRKHLL